MTTPIKIKPEAIEARSFEIIREEFMERTGLRPENLPPSQFDIIQRVIHATGDFDFAKLMAFHSRAVSSAITALRAGMDIMTDVNMVAAGINQKLLAPWGGRVICRIADQDIAELAASRQATRAETAIKETLKTQPGIVAIGNAPTALLRLMELIADLPANDRPRLIIGVPVGFVNAEESKQILSRKDYPFITSLGRKGGSSIAAAIVNALLKLAQAAQ